MSRIPKPESATQSPRMVLVCLGALLAACTDGRWESTSPVAPQPAVPTADSVAVQVVVSDGIQASVPAGTRWVRRGETFEYRFATTSGYAGLVVRVNDTVQAPNGRLVVSRGTSVTAIAFPDTSASQRTAFDAEFEQLVTTATPARKLDSLVARYSAADSITRERMDHARYRSILRLGPEQYQAYLDRLDQDAEAESTQASPTVGTPVGLNTPNLQATTAAPRRLSVIYVNGWFNGPLGSEGGRVALEAALRGRTLSAGGVKIGKHVNRAIILDASDPARCLKEIQWLLALTSGSGGIQPSSVLLSRLYEVLTRRVNSECLSTNARAVIDYLAQRLGTSTALTPADARLLARIESERRNGANVLVVGHSQATLIVRNVLAQLKPKQDALGCVGFIGVGGPLQSGSGISTNLQFVSSLSAKGTVSGVQDILYAFDPGRQDGRPSVKTAQLDATWQGSSWLDYVPVASQIRGTLMLSMQLDLHGFVATYTASDGYASALGDQAEAAADALNAVCPAPAEVNRSVDISVATATVVAAREAVTRELGIALSNPNAVPVTVRLSVLQGLLPAGITATLNSTAVTLGPREAIRASDASAPRVAVTVEPGVPAVRVALAIAATATAAPASCATGRVTVTDAGTEVTTGGLTVRFTGAAPRDSSIAAAQVTLNGSQTVVTWQHAREASLALALVPGPNTLAIRLVSGTGVASYRLPEPFGSDGWVALGFITHTRMYFLRTFTVDTTPGYYSDRAAAACDKVTGAR